MNKVFYRRTDTTAVELFCNKNNAEYFVTLYDNRFIAFNKYDISSSQWSKIWDTNALFDSGWQNLPLSSETKMYGDTPPRYRKCGSVVQVVGNVSPKEEKAGWSGFTIGTLPEGYRPAYDTCAICQGSLYCIWLLNVSSDGTLYCSRYRSGAVAETIGTGAWCVFSCTFIAT